MPKLINEEAEKINFVMPPIKGRKRGTSNIYVELKCITQLIFWASLGMRIELIKV